MSDPTGEGVSTPPPEVEPEVAPAAAAALPAAPDPVELLRSRSYLQLLLLPALIGVPVSAVAYFFLALVSRL